jgi:hypothetical protein
MAIRSRRTGCRHATAPRRDCPFHVSSTHASATRSEGGAIRGGGPSTDARPVAAGFGIGRRALTAIGTPEEQERADAKTSSEYSIMCDGHDRLVPVGVTRAA